MILNHRVLENYMHPPPLIEVNGQGDGGLLFYLVFSPPRGSIAKASWSAGLFFLTDLGCAIFLGLKLDFLCGQNR